MTPARYRLLLAVLSASMLLIAVFSLGVGQYRLPVVRIVQILASPFGGAGQAIPAIEQQVVWDVRLPRVLLALLVGSGLALCGATLQGVFRNPLVDPHIIGVSSGAAFGGTLAILLGWPSVMLLLCAFASGMAALLLVFLIASLLGRQHILVLILAGVILSGFFGALVSLMQYLADTEEKLPSIVFWLLGSFATAHWHSVFTLAIPLVLAGGLLLRLRWRINVLSMGEQDAVTLGMRGMRLRWLILTLCAAIVAAQVAVSGSIGWIGLVVPHIARLWVGPDHRRLLPTAMCLGGGFMVLVDDLARSITTAEVPLGILTALLGAPAVVIVLCRYRQEVKG
ncbi:FecCD family ABC transporter permease [Musicola keenii]|uniref:FecCD family ABC transporter permease n=1 Tax=Musicola keenii TaxID=2884250 RepID=UPI0017853E68|nr:iron ABC transporter permease [Musicola keenii]